MRDKIRYPILELTDWVFEAEKTFTSESEWNPTHYIKEKDFEKQYKRVMVDSDGNILKISGKKVVGKKGALFSLIVPPTLIVEFDIEKTGQTISLEELKKLILLKKDQQFNIIHNELMTEDEFVDRVNNSKDYKELILVASFEEDPTNNFRK